MAFEISTDPAGREEYVRVTLAFKFGVYALQKNEIGVLTGTVKLSPSLGVGGITILGDCAMMHWPELPPTHDVQPESAVHEAPM